jgi:hypothetical protein
MFNVNNNKKTFTVFIIILIALIAVVLEPLGQPAPYLLPSC